MQETSIVERFVEEGGGPERQGDFYPWSLIGARARGVRLPAVETTANMNSLMHDHPPFQDEECCGGGKSRRRHGGSDAGASQRNRGGLPGRRWGRMLAVVMIFSMVHSTAPQVRHAPTMLTFAAGDDSNVGIGPCLECIAARLRRWKGVGNDWESK